MEGRPHRPLAGASPSLGKRLQSRPGGDMGQAEYEYALEGDQGTNKVQ